MEPRHCTNMTWSACWYLPLRWIDFKIAGCADTGHQLGAVPVSHDLTWVRASDAEDGFVNAEEFSCPSEVGLLLCTLQTHRTETCGCVQRGGWPADALFRAHGFAGKGTKWINMDSIWTQNGTKMHIHHVQTTWCQVAAFLPHVTPLFFFAMVGISVWKRDWPEFEICCFFAWNLWRASNVLSI